MVLLEIHRVHHHHKEIMVEMDLEVIQTLTFNVAVVVVVQMRLVQMVHHRQVEMVAMELHLQSLALL
jgi:hypothetical protein